MLLIMLLWLEIRPNKSVGPVNAVSGLPMIYNVLHAAKSLRKNKMG